MSNERVCAASGAHVDNGSTTDDPASKMESDCWLVADR